MDEGVKKRILFREVNEQIREINHAFAVLTGNYEVFCECARAHCLERLEVPVSAYEDARSREHFLIRPGHEHPGLDRVLADCATYRIVDAHR